MSVPLAEICLSAGECQRHRGLACSHAVVALQSAIAFDRQAPSLRIVAYDAVLPAWCTESAEQAASSIRADDDADGESNANSEVQSERGSSGSSWADQIDEEPRLPEPGASGTRKPLRLAESLRKLESEDHNCVLRFSRCGRLGIHGADLLRNYLQMSFGKVNQVLQVNPAAEGRKPKMMFVVMASSDSVEKILQTDIHEVIPGVQVDVRKFETKL